MVTRYFLFIIILLSLGCEKKLYELSMLKTPYAGNELRIDGYYYSNQVFNNHNGIAIFYKDGVCFHLFAQIESHDTLNYIENEILLDKALMRSFWNTPNHIGVFQINGKSIMFETWEVARDITTFSNFGEILNDTTFLITNQVNNDSGKSYSENLTYRFRQFSPKPDSTNTFITDLKITAL